MNIEEVKAWKCTKCGTTYIDQSFAEKCCKPKYCEDCGAELKYKWYQTVCESCAEKRYYDKSIKMTIEEYNETYTNNMVFYKDNYYSSVDECLESLFDRCSNENEVKELVDTLEYIYGTDSEDIVLDGDSIVEHMEEESNLEDFTVDVAGYKELNNFLVDWNKKYGTKCYMQNKVVILIPRELREEYENR